jgi:hypothetical protein
MMFEILFVTSIILNIILFLIIKKCLSKIDILEGWILTFKNNIESLYKNLKSIDERGMFEKDDDVGVLFLQIHDIIKNVKNIVLDDEFIDDEEKNPKN